MAFFGILLILGVAAFLVVRFVMECFNPRSRQIRLEDEHRKRLWAAGFMGTAMSALIKILTRGRGF